jgi:hypothetical protein
MFTHFDPGFLDNPEFKEDSVREVIIAPILARLGYQPSGQTRVVRSKALVHPFIFVGTRKHPVTIIPDYTLLHNDQPLLILDAKSPTEDILKRDHVQQAYSYAIHPEIRCKHFALCNGKHLAVFHVEQSEPLLVLSFNEFESRWSDIEKNIAPRFLLKPELRNFSPDFGFKLNHMGFDVGAELVMIGVRLDLFARINDELFTAGANCDFGGEEHCVSFDFPSELLGSILAGLPIPLATEFRGALSRAPYQAIADLVIELDIEVRLGSETRGQHESFVPLIISKVLASRFNLSPMPFEPTDRPPHIFRLRNAFKLKQVP